MHRHTPPRGRARGTRASDAKAGRDATRYSRFHPGNYLSHHMASIVCNAVMYDADHIEHQIVALQLANKTKHEQQRAQPSVPMPRSASCAVAPHLFRDV